MNPVWDEYEVLSTNKSSSRVRCLSCTHEFTSTGVARLVEHFTSGTGVKVCSSDERGALCRKYSRTSAPSATPPRGHVASQPGLPHFFKSAPKQEADDANADFFLEEGIAFSKIRGASWKRAVAKITAAGPGYISPGYNKLREEALDSAHARTEVRVQPIIAAALCATGFSVCSDGWTDTVRRPLVNVVLMTPGGSVFLRAYDTTGEKKGAKYLADLIREQLEAIGPDSCVLVVTDNAAACKAAGALLQAEYPHITWVGCVAHCMDLILKDIVKLPWAAELAAKVKAAVKVILNHQSPLALYGKHSPDLKLLLPGDTRFASFFLMLKRFIAVRGSLRKMINDPDWDEWVAGAKPKVQIKARAAEDTINSKSILRLAQALINATGPVVSLLRMADCNVPCLGKVYYRMYSLGCTLRDAGLDTDHESAVEDIFTERWEYMHNDIYAAGYALDPEFLFAGHDFTKIREVMKGLKATCIKMLGMDDALLAMTSYTARYLKRLGSFSGEMATLGAQRMAAHTWWEVNGADAPELQRVAVKILAQVPAACLCERNWSDYDYVHSKRRNCLTAARAERCVYVYRNSREATKTHGVFDEESVAWAYEPEEL